jgi:Xaa-Pro aminopeptidase
MVMMDRAVLFVDGRYTLQAREQVDASLFAVEHLIDMPPNRWIEENLTADDRLGYDPWLHTVEAAERLEKACAAAGAKLIAVEPDLIDAVWADRPAPPLGAVALHDLRFAGEAAGEKLARIRAELTKLRADALVVSDPHAIAWAFNIRGGDVAHTPLPLAFAIIPQAGRPSLYIDGRKLSNEVRSCLETLADLREPSAFTGALEDLGQRKNRVRIDQGTAADALARLITSHGGKVIKAPCPIGLMKAVKNEVEIAGAIRDGVAASRASSPGSIGGSARKLTRRRRGGARKLSPRTGLPRTYLSDHRGGRTNGHRPHASRPRESTHRTGRALLIDWAPNTRTAPLEISPAPLPSPS